MGKEADFDAHAVIPGDEINWKLGHMGLVGSPRTPLRTLIARESGSLWTSEATDPALLKSPGKERVKSGSGRLKPLEGKAGRNGALVKAGSPSPQSGSSSPKTFGTRIGLVSHKIRVFKKAGVVQAIPQPAERPVQLGALFAQEREETRRVAVDPHVQPLRDLIAAELASSCAAAQRVGMQVDDHRVSNGRSLRSPSPRNMGATKPMLASDESQELRYLFAKDWALQTSDEEDEFWDSGSLCGAPMPSRSFHEKPRRRSRFYKNEKLSSLSQPTSKPEIEIVEVQELHVQSPGPGCCILSDEFPKGVTCGGPKPSLGTLLAEEVATSSDSPLADRRWSVPAAESSRRVKIGSLDDISAPVRPESQSQLDFLIAKILTLRANSVTGNAEPIVTRLSGEDDGGCSASGSIPTPQVGEVSNQTFLSGVPDAAETAAATDVNMSIVDAPNILLMNPSSVDIKEAPSALTQEVPTSTSTDVETPIMVTDAGAAEIRDEGEEASTSRINPDSGDVEAIPRVQLGTLLERTWGDHGWLPLCCSSSPMGSPLPGPSQPSSSSTSRFNCEGSPREVPSGPSPLLSPVRDPPAEAVTVEATETVESVREADATPARERPPTRVSLLSLLNQDMEMDEDRLQVDVCGCRDDEEDEVVTEELDPMCCVCMVGHKGAAFIPCGHTFCRKCCREVRRSIGSCPLCNQGIVDVLKLY
ncbi:hypothetical protein KC19_10G189100 [Ceratodon purpureus]|uniref:RING-type domain-containing protein n=1 Tax=Ceratodon purpureus TaxID=3225 RepID=A0A8T0GS88_CERPU|nr:hypothetical protein KC19_10G189100 [Ceratodon purpureus]